MLSGIAGADNAAELAKKMQDPLADGCKAELESYCKDVKPGDGRILACLYSRADKLSGKCEYALYDAAVQLERAVAALAYVANECADDRDNHSNPVLIHFL